MPQLLWLAVDQQSFRIQNMCAKVRSTDSDISFTHLATSMQVVVLKPTNPSTNLLLPTYLVHGTLMSHPLNTQKSLLLPHPSPISYLSFLAKIKMIHVRPMPRVEYTRFHLFSTCDHVLRRRSRVARPSRKRRCCYYTVNSDLDVI